MLILSAAAAIVLSYSLRVQNSRPNKGAEPAITLSVTNRGRTALKMLRGDDLMVNYGRASPDPNGDHYAFPLNGRLSAADPYRLPPGATRYLWGSAKHYVVLHGFRDYFGSGTAVTIRYCELLGNGEALAPRPVWTCSNAVTIVL